MRWAVEGRDDTLDGREAEQDGGAAASRGGDRQATNQRRTREMDPQEQPMPGDAISQAGDEGSQQAPGKSAGHACEPNLDDPAEQVRVDQQGDQVGVLGGDAQHPGKLSEADLPVREGTAERARVSHRGPS